MSIIHLMSHMGPPVANYPLSAFGYVYSHTIGNVLYTISVDNTANHALLMTIHNDDGCNIKWCNIGVPFYPDDLPVVIRNKMADDEFIKLWRNLIVTTLCDIIVT